MFHEEGKALNTFVGPQGYTQCVRCNLILFTEKTPQGTFKEVK